MQGFLPKKLPAKSYSTQSESCSRIEEICNNLPKLLLTGQVQKTIKKLSKKTNKILRSFLTRQAPERLNLP